MGFTCTILITWEAELMRVLPAILRVHVEAADQLLSVFTLGLTKYVFALMDYLRVCVDSSCPPAVEAPLG